MKCTSEEPTDYRSALDIPAWKQAMDAEIDSHKRNDTWELVGLPKGKKTWKMGLQAKTVRTWKHREA